MGSGEGIVITNLNQVFLQCLNNFVPALIRGCIYFVYLYYQVPAILKCASVEILILKIYPLCFPSLVPKIVT